VTFEADDEDDARANAAEQAILDANVSEWEVMEEEYETVEVKE
jgi:hypothetical protein